MLDRGTRLTPSQALLVGLQATRALDYAHRRGFVHRDVKPANLLFGEDGRLRIADFGLARALAEAAWTEPQGAVLGTARYASPEQAQGEAVDGRADVYSLGLVLIEAVTGSVPFAADTTIATLMARVGRSVEVPAALGELRRPLERAGQAVPGGPTRRRCARRRARWRAPGSCPGPSRSRSSPASRPSRASSDDGDVTLMTATDNEALTGTTTLPVFLDDDVGDDEYRRRRRWPWVVLAILFAAALGGGGARGSGTTPARRPTTCPGSSSLTEDQAHARP